MTGEVVGESVWYLMEYVCIKSEYLMKSEGVMTIKGEK